MRPIFITSFVVASHLFCFLSELNAVEYQGRDYRDPFALGLQKRASVKDEIIAKGFSLEGIVWSSKKPQAIICNQVVSEGNEVNGAKVLAVNRDGVKLKYKEQEFTLKPGT